MASPRRTSRSIAEHSAAGTAVGAPVTGTPYNGVALTYSLTGKAKDSGLFVIDSATGQIKVATGATLDYETDDSHRETETWNGEVIAKFYRGKVNYTVDGHAAATIDVIVKVTNIGRIRRSPTAPKVTRTEFSEPTSPALDVTWTAPAAAGHDHHRDTRRSTERRPRRMRTPRRGRPTAARWAPRPPRSTWPAWTAGATYEAQVRAVTSQEGHGSVVRHRVRARANRAPAASSCVLQRRHVQGQAAPSPGYEETGAGLGSGAFFTDADGDALTYSAAAQHPALLGVTLSGTAGNAATDRVNLLNQGSSKVTYTARDAYGGSVTRTDDHRHHREGEPQHRRDTRRPARR